ncbi:hypothetical protein [Azotobacter vinelandii]|uniref:hypothetical protein n=1 Tax=Azotobacter vinelandii TaxID=354 RepID=UPI000913CFED|nr:hypothetical protein [Azotobacter vinelandii]SFY33677.1 hypothetical protein SAMN04244547_05167 [Azotobacter vinelandii]
MTTYRLPDNYYPILEGARSRALSDPLFAYALRGIGTYPKTYAQGVLAALGLPSLGEDFAAAARSVETAIHRINAALAADEATQAGIPGDAERELLFGCPPRSPALEQAHAEFADSRAWYETVERLVKPFEEAGYTPDYDGAPS